MAPTTVVNLRTTPYDVYIGKPRPGQDGTFGNPYWVNREAIRLQVIEQYRTYFHDRMQKDADFRAKVLALKGKRLGCFCVPKPCHGQVIADYLNGLP